MAGNGAFRTRPVHLGAVSPANDSGTGHRLETNARIAIIGAGPSGITAAATYHKLGYRNVVVLEKQRRIGGRAETTALGNDMGAGAWAPKYYDELNEITDELGITRSWLPRPLYRSVEHRKFVPPIPYRQGPKLVEQTLRYLRTRPRYEGIDGPIIRRVSKEAHTPWTDFAREQNLEVFGRIVAPAAEGFGYRADAPALYNLRYFHAGSVVAPTLAMFNPMHLGSGLGCWDGGTQQIWERMAARHNVDVRLGVNIERITRSPKGVQIAMSGEREPMTFDYLVLACQPAHLRGALDLTDDEQGLFSQYRVYDYRTYECEMSGFEGKAAYVTIQENLDAVRGMNRPVVIYKRAKHSPFAVVFVNADGSASDEQIIENIRIDLGRTGAGLKRVHTRRKHDYMPHVNGESLANGFYERLWQLQGRNRTLGVGASHTFDILPDVVAQAQYCVTQHVAGALPGVGVFSERRKKVRVA